MLLWDSTDLFSLGHCLAIWSRIDHTLPRFLMIFPQQSINRVIGVSAKPVPASASRSELSMFFRVSAGDVQ